MLLFFPLTILSIDYTKDNFVPTFCENLFALTSINNTNTLYYRARIDPIHKIFWKSILHNAETFNTVCAIFETKMAQMKKSPLKHI